MITVLAENYTSCRSIFTQCKYVVSVEVNRFSFDTNFDRFGFNTFREAIRFAAKQTKWWNLWTPDHVSLSIGEVKHNNRECEPLVEQIRQRAWKELKDRKIHYSF